jgi:diadenosine tetraphosphate (Ap4A) HIT family hydrolase
MDGQWECSKCGFRLYLPIEAPDLKVSQLGLYNDGRFPGRCILALNTHSEHLEELDPRVRAQFWDDAARVGWVIRRLTGATRINYAVLGNGTPHLHIHLIPRQPAYEELPTRSPWNDPRNAFELDPGQLRALVSRIEAGLLRE